MNININRISNSNISYRGNLSTIINKLFIERTMPEEQFDQLASGIRNKPLDEDDIIALTKIKSAIEIHGYKYPISIKSIKEFFANKLIAKAKDETYNGTPAKVTRSLSGRIFSVNTGAKNIEEAREDMGLDKICTFEGINRNGESVTTYGREYKDGNKIVSEYFLWNPKTKSMDFIWRE